MNNGLNNTATKRLARISHAFQTWENPKRKTTFTKFHNGIENTNYKLHYTNEGLESVYNPNKEPKSIVQAREKANKIKGKRNYVVYFIHFIGKTESFLKIGMTSKTIEERFNQDCKRFKYDVLCKSPMLTHSGAFALEQALIKLFRSNRKRPKEILFSGGNTECFEYSENMLKEAIKIISSV